MSETGNINWIDCATGLRIKNTSSSAEGERIMEAIKVLFKFDVGDFVQTAWDAQTQPKGDKHLRGVWQVIERIFCEHCGGHRIQYVCRSHEAFANKQQTAAFDACELVAVEVSE